MRAFNAFAKCRLVSRPRQARPHESAEAAKYKSHGAGDENAEQWTLVGLRVQDDWPDETGEERDNADDKPRQKCALHLYAVIGIVAEQSKPEREQAEKEQHAADRKGDWVPTEVQGRQKRERLDKRQRAD